MVRVRPLVHTFETRQVHDPLAFVRTFGTVVEAEPGPLRFGRENAVEHAHPAPPDGCARGKVAAYARNGGWCDAVCYQISDCRTLAQVVACCNGTAAAAAVCAQGPSTVRMRVGVPGGGRLRVDARVTGGPRPAVEQTWIAIPFCVKAAGRYALCTGALNDYVIVRADPDAFPVSEALRLWERFGLQRDPLRSRIAVVEDAPAPRARFFTCGEREHPSAPLTGLAVIALAAGRLGWPAIETLETPAGPMPLPRVRERDDGTADVEFPRVVVRLGAA